MVLVLVSFSQILQIALFKRNRKSILTWAICTFPTSLSRTPPSLPAPVHTAPAQMASRIVELFSFVYSFVGKRVFPQVCMGNENNYFPLWGNMFTIMSISQALQRCTSTFFGNGLEYVRDISWEVRK